MARTVATLPAGSRITDYISLGVIAKTFPLTAIRSTLARTHKASDLPAHVVVLACDRRLPDGSYLSRIYPSGRDRRHNTGGIVVRVIDYKLDGVEGAEPIYRLVTTILDHGNAPAKELAALYHERWETETALDELKTHLRGSKIVLRSKTPDLVRQEFHGFVMAHFAIRGLTHEAALKAGAGPTVCPFCTPYALSAASWRFRTLFPPRRRKSFHDAVRDEILQERVVTSRNRRNLRGVKRKMSSFLLRPRHTKPLPPIDIRKAIRIVK